MSASLRTFLPAYRGLAKLGLPILVGQLGQIVVGFADNIMVGRYSTDALAAASLVNNLFNVAILCCVGFTYGLTPLAGALFGAGRRGRIGSLTRLALKLNLLYTAVIMAVMAVIYANLDRLGQPGHLLPLIRPYFLISLAGMLPVVLFNVIAQWSYAINRTAMPMWIILGANVLNVAGNYALIFGHFGLPELGLTGAGLSTLASRTVSAAAILVIFFAAGAFRDYRGGFRHGVNPPGETRLLWRTSLPVSLQMTFETASFSVAAVMVGWLGHIELAAYQIFIIIGTLGFCVYYSIGAAIAVKVSNSAAAPQPGAAMRHYAWAGYHIMLVFMVIACTIFLTAGRTLITAFTSDVAVISVAGSLILPMVLYQLGDATQVAFANALRGTSHVMPMLWIAFVSYIPVGISGTYLLGFTAGLETPGIILSFSISLFLAGGLFLTYFLKATREGGAGTSLRQKVQ